MAELINGGESEHSLAVYLLSADEELLGCAFLKKLDEDTAALYDELLNGLGQEKSRSRRILRLEVRLVCSCLCLPSQQSELLPCWVTCLLCKRVKIRCGYECLGREEY